MSVEQNIQQTFFAHGAPLRDEFKKLFDSLFKGAAGHAACRQAGRHRSRRTGRHRAPFTGRRHLSVRLQDLVAAGFVQELVPFDRARGEYYRLIDEFSLFHLRWVAPARNKRVDENYWVSQSGKPAYRTWAGYAFENVCLGHVDRILEALPIPGGSMASSWLFVPRKHEGRGAQIDLLIDRSDDAITLCEIKYSAAPFVIDKQYAGSLRNKMEVFREKPATQKQIFIAMIAANGLKNNVYSEDLISGVLTADDLCR